MINLPNVSEFAPSDEQKLVKLVDGTTVTVQEPYEVVAEMVNPEREAGC